MLSNETILTYLNRLYPVLLFIQMYKPADVAMLQQTI